MKTVNITLGAVALIFASSTAVKADLLLAGPIPVTQPGHITCSALNVSLVPETVRLVILDKLGIPVLNGFTNCVLAPTQTCQVIARTPPSDPSPYTCEIDSDTIPPSTVQPPVRGSICGEHSDATYCLQALLNNHNPGLGGPGGP